MNKRNFSSLLFSIVLFCFFSSNAIQFRSDLNSQQMDNMYDNFESITGQRFNENTALSDLQDSIIRLVRDNTDVTLLQNFMMYVAQINWNSGFNARFTVAAAQNSDNANRIREALGELGMGLTVTEQDRSDAHQSALGNASVDNFSENQVREDVYGIFDWLSQCSVQDLTLQNISDQRDDWIRRLGLEDE